MTRLHMALRKISGMAGICWLILLPALPAAASECAVLLHGLGRTANSMKVMQSGLREAGYQVVNINYPSRKKTIEELAEQAVGEGLDECARHAAAPINFVTHSLGGILVRQYFREHPTENLRRVVMLGPPNNGSEIVDALEQLPLIRDANGPAGRQLGTDGNSVPKKLGPVNFQLGVIAGNQSVSFMSAWLPNPDDGKVSVESTKVGGMCSFLLLPVTHTFMMRNRKVIGQTLHFLQNGLFDDTEAQQFECAEISEPAL